MVPRMTFLGAVDVVHHLLDYELPGGVTAHQILIAAIALVLIRQRAGRLGRR